MSTPSSAQASGVVLYVKLIFDVPETRMEHIAELSPTDDPTLCQMLRIVEVRDGRPVGYAQQGESKNMNVPEPFVPHPDTYGDFPDVSFEYVGAEHFNALWAQALATL
ncbi:hypothetical protein [Corynebacterium argentoratense]|uniref:hypothetical protein n=1 Tax=Corynebacterium argentoratense TaxID=42817 RepID=UPI0028F05144|nr:hypothetical protein [Corynebacterium argentoratense]